MPTTGSGRGTCAHERVRVRDGAPRLRKAAARRARVLVIDDEPILLKTFERLLGQDHAITSLGDAREALARVRSGERFDVIVCDLMMPHLSGMGLYDAVRAIDPTLAERMVFITGGAFTREAEEFLQRVPNPRVQKPWDGLRLRALLQGIIERQSAEP